MIEHIQDVQKTKGTKQSNLKLTLSASCDYVYPVLSRWKPSHWLQKIILYIYGTLQYFRNCNRFRDIELVFFLEITSKF